MDIKKQTSTSKEAVLDSDRTLFDTLGDELKRARQSAGYEIDDVADMLKIKPVFLQALEKNDYLAFPAIVYGVAFLRSYADFLGLDANAMVERFKDETEHLVSVPEELPIRSNHSIVPNRWLYTALALLSLVGIVSWGSTLFPDQKESTPVVSENLGPAIEIRTIDTGEAPVVTDNLVQESALADQTSAQVEAAVQPTKTVYGEADKSDLYLEANGRSWIEVRDGERVIFNRVLEKGDVFYVPRSAAEPVLDTGNASVLAVYVKGVYKGRLSEKETVKHQVVLTEEGLGLSR